MQQIIAVKKKAPVLNRRNKKSNCEFYQWGKKNISSMKIKKEEKQKVLFELKRSKETNKFTKQLRKLHHNLILKIQPKIHLKNYKQLITINNLQIKFKIKKHSFNQKSYFEGIQKQQLSFTQNLNLNTKIMGNNSSCSSTAFVIQKEYGGMIDYTDFPVNNNYSTNQYASTKKHNQNSHSNKSSHKTFLFNQKSNTNNIGLMNY